jgi:hypothetical protein
LIRLTGDCFRPPVLFRFDADAVERERRDAAGLVALDRLDPLVPPFRAPRALAAEPAPVFLRDFARPVAPVVARRAFPPDDFDRVAMFVSS